MAEAEGAPAPQEQGAHGAQEQGDYANLRDEPLVRAMSALLRTVHLDTGAGQVPAKLAAQVQQTVGAQLDAEKLKLEKKSGDALVGELVATTSEGLERFYGGVLGDALDQVWTCALEEDAGGESADPIDVEEVVIAALLVYTHEVLPAVLLPTAVSRMQFDTDTDGGSGSAEPDSGKAKDDDVDLLSLFQEERAAVMRTTAGCVRKKLLKTEWREKCEKIGRGVYEVMSTRTASL